MHGFHVVHILQGGPDVHIIDARGQKWKFEDHPHFGPFVLGKNGDSLENQPPESSPFWDAVNCWYQQGKATESMGGETLAKWVKPTISKMIAMGGNHYMLYTSELKIHPRKMEE